MFENGAVEEGSRVASLPWEHIHAAIVPYKTIPHNSNTTKRESLIFAIGHINLRGPLAVTHTTPLLQVYRLLLKTTKTHFII